MDSLFHFIFAFIVGLALGLHIKHKLTFVFFVALLATLIDVDHLFLLFNPAMFPVNEPLHNIFVIALLPFVLFLIAFYFERKKGSIYFQSFFLILMVLLIGHVVADMFYRPIALLYPLSTMQFAFPDFELLLPSEFYLPLISKQGLALAAYALVVLAGVFVGDFIYFFEKKHERAKQALKDTFKDLF